MLKNYFRIALRNLLKNKTYVIINTFGLGISMACCITAYLLVAYNIEFDDFHDDEKVENFFRVHAHVTFNDANKGEQILTPSTLAPMAMQDIPGIKRFTRYCSGGTNISYKNNVFSEGIWYADSTFFEMFDFPLAAGSYSSFKDLHSIFINEEMALKYFGDEDPIGKVLTLSFAREVEKNVIVGGVFEDMPVNNSTYFRAIIRFEHYEEIRALETAPWGDWNMPSTIFELSSPEQAEDVEPLFDKYATLRNEAKTDQVVEKYTLHHFKEKIDRANFAGSQLNTPIEIEPLIVFITLALMILLIACFNLTNTSIAMTATRLKEIGVRKSLGAYKRQIVSQFMFETILVILLSLLVGLVLSKIIVPEFAAMWDIPFGIEDMNGLNLVITLLIIVFFAAILAGVYPALFSSKFNAVTLLKGTIKVKGTNAMTRTLVSMQFAFSVIVLIAGVIFIQNAKFQENVQFGYDKTDIVTVSIQNEKEYYAMAAKAKANPKIKNIGVTDHQIGFGTYSAPINFEGEEYSVHHAGVGINFFETMGFTFIEGRPLDYEKASDYANAAVVSREFLAKVNLQGNPIGQQVEIHGTKRRIVGVIENFLDNLYRSKDPEPFVFYPSEKEVWKLMILKTEPGELTAVDEFLETTWKDMYPTKPYRSRYQEDILLEDTKQYNGNLKKIFLFLTLLGGFLSAAGIYSLASLNIAKRTKEIGIRKALGATVKNVVLLLNKEFIIILTIAGILGSAGGFYGTEWLLGLIYELHVAVGLIPVIFSAVLIFTIGISTTSVTIFKAAKANPVDTLRDE